MRELVLLALVVPCLQAQSMDCAPNASTQTERVSGSAGVTAVLRIDSDDDHGKNTHLCMADYRLLIMPDHPSFDFSVHGFIASDADWGRRLSAHLDGFSQDGSHVFGVIAEGGAYSSATVLDCLRATGNVQTIQIRNPQAPLRAARCGTSFAVAGTAGDSAIVLEPNTTSPCRTQHRWLLDQTGNLLELPLDKPFQHLYRTPR